MANCLELALGRAKVWADQLFCVIDPDCGVGERTAVDSHSDAYVGGRFPLVDDETLYRREAWAHMSEALAPGSDDWVVCIDSDEIVLDPRLVTKAAKTFSDKKVGFVVYNIWSRDEYRVDGRFAPKVEWLMFPYRSGAHWGSGSTARTPDYVSNLLPVSRPLTDIVHFGYKNSVLRHRKLLRDAARGRMTEPEMLSAPILERWKKGGLPRG
jgi:hypothetical protein